MSEGVIIGGVDVTEIEKMYENVGIKLNEGLEWVCKNPDHCTYQNLSIVPENCTRCEYFERERIYPPFTAEKQLELIKKLGNINIDIDNGCYMSSEILEVEAHCDEFEETLAEFVNNLWQDLTDSEKEEIRRILNENS